MFYRILKTSFVFCVGIICRGTHQRSRSRKGNPIMKKLVASSCAQFCVDLCCAALFFGYLNASPQWWLCMALYNTCAFALQLPLGLIADTWNRNLLFASLGCVLVCVSFFLKEMSLPEQSVCIWAPLLLRSSTQMAGFFLLL